MKITLNYKEKKMNKMEGMIDRTYKLVNESTILIESQNEELIIYLDQVR